uniref:Monoglyceride lipase n=1 Tax=Anthurium amnicola TaxID=1678845 RepID=A0A1D1ZAR8_9ARAE
MISIGTSLPASGTRLGVVISDRFDEKGWKRHHCQQRHAGVRETKQQRAVARMESVVKVTPAVGAAPAALILTSGASGRVNALLSLSALRSLLLLLNGLLLLLLAPFQHGAARFVARAASQPPSVGGSAEKGKGDEKLEGSRLGKRSSVAPVVVRVPAAMVPRRAGEAASRRAMAIRRLAVEEEGGEKGGRSKKDFSLFVTARGDTLFTRSWGPVTAPPKGLVVFLHGLNEHSGRYNFFAKKLNDLGFKVYGMDWIGHGGSDGLHGYVHSLDYAVNDTKSFLVKVLEENHGLPCFCFGHSTGGAIILKAVLDPKIEPLVQGVVLTSPALRVQPSHPIVAVMAPIISFLMPRYQFSAADKKGLPVSRDPAALVAKYSDPLVFTGSIRVRTGYEILRITTYLQQHLKNVNVPFLVLHGTADTVTDPEATQQLYDEACSADKSIKLYDGFLHDLLFEPEGEDIANDIIGWLSSRTKGLSTME